MAGSKKKLTVKQKKLLIRIIVGIVLLAADMVATHLVELPKLVQLAMFLIPFAVAGYDIVIKAVRHIVSGQMLDENLLMTIATIGAFAVGEYSEGAAVMLFYQVGELFQNIAVTRSRKSIAALMDIRPDTAVVIRGGDRLEVDPDTVEVGETIEVRAGEKLPLDGVVLSGETSLDTAALTGESLPREVRPGDEVLSGCVNLTGIITVRTTKPFGESTASKILRLVEQSSSKKARSENFITRFARVYTPAVVGAAALLAFLPPLVSSIALRDSVYRALNFLVVSCPCALVISVPMSFFGGIGGASRQGVLIKGGNYLEALSGVDTVIFDKTGTLTLGRPEVKKLLTSEACGEARLVSLAAAAERNSNHPIAQSIIRYASETGAEIPAAEGHTEIAGRGIACTLEGSELLAGNLRLMQERGIAPLTEDNSGTMVHIALGGEYMGCITLGDSLKEGSRDAITALSEMGVDSVILTGDSRAAGEAAAAELGVKTVHT
ncbi:MAG: cadmium-translocating P-type ATPase, partial [Ruminococcus sp.]|nr:cadmium-translocating P-type ATPase [Ruminococcus sp.]